MRIVAQTKIMSGHLQLVAYDEATTDKYEYYRVYSNKIEDIEKTLREFKIEAKKGLKEAVKNGKTSSHSTK